MHPYIFVYKVTRCNMHNLSAFEQELCIMEQTYPHPISEIALTSIAPKASSGAIEVKAHGVRFSAAPPPPPPPNTSYAATSGDELGRVKWPSS